ncbi:MAG: hypothetical protein P4N60_13865 [Verrucomicrobiae bacterium]|nr:hypothetical protein [Verrucomicrobiae bacterium]
MKTTAGIVIVILTIVGSLLIAIFWKTPDPVVFKPMGRDSVLGTLTWLFVVALFIERAVEVIVSTCRDADADVLEHNVTTAQAKIDAQTKVTPGSVPYLDPLHGAQKEMLKYRSETKQFAMCVSFILSIFVALAGVRTFGSIVETYPAGNWLFSAADIIVTGAVLAGGTDAIHQMMNVVMNFLNQAADKAKGS